MAWSSFWLWKMRLLWRDRVDTLSQLRARDRPAGFSLRKEEDLLSPLILTEGKSKSKTGG